MNESKEEKNPIIMNNSPFTKMECKRQSFVKTNAFTGTVQRTMYKNDYFNFFYKKRNGCLENDE
ncbi:hypothetical protein [Bacillus sp. OK048]|uniref:hypothetical protein n=1 Tax=Bacillus sp. OK048 TaxID=1882761 RepID=UPI001113AEE7|nr:hypothetical protein [Bacillus sp. OK048]